MNKSLLKVENLTMKFGGLTAIDNLSFTANNNEITSIIGPNGAGKTTVFNCLTGFYKPTNGEMFLNKNNEKLAIKISSDPDYLKNIKEKIKKNKLETNLFKSKDFTKNLENGYIKVFQNYIEGNKTRNFEL